MFYTRSELLEKIRLDKSYFLEIKEICFLRKKKRCSPWPKIASGTTQVTNKSEKILKSAAGELLAKMPEKGEAIRQLAYHLYTLCERKKWAEDARAYNELIGSWNAIVAASHEAGIRGEQTGLDF